MGDAILTNKESPRYVMDELGSALRHSDDPNFQVAPFMFLPDGTLKSAIRAMNACVTIYLELEKTSSGPPD